MASSKVMPSTSSAPNSDLTHQLPFPIPPDLQPAISTTSMDDFLKNIYGDASSSQNPHITGSPFVPPPSAEEIEAEMTLEDFLTRAASADALPPPQCFANAVNVTNSVINGGLGVVPGVAVVGRGKRRAMEEPVVDKATQQRQRRMIKNRESAARSRERKQAYTVELETMVAQLEEENTQLQNEEAQVTKERYKQLMENLIPVTEKRRPPRPLRRVNSMGWIWRIHS